MKKRMMKLMALAAVATLATGTITSSVYAGLTASEAQIAETGTETNEPPSDEGGNPPEKPDDGENPPEKPDDGENPPDDGGEPGEPGGPGGGSEPATYDAVKTITSDTEESAQTYESTTGDQNALLVSGAKVTESNLTVTKTGDSSGGDSCNFYGLNAAVLAKDGAELTIDGAVITTDAEGANGVFSYGGNGAQNDAAGDGTTVNITNAIITTKGNGSGGIMTTGGGVTNANNLTVETSGRSSAAIRTDRGGGTVNVTGGIYTTNGTGSPAIYSTADISVSDATLTSTASEGVVIEGKNTVTLTDTTLVANNTQKNGNATHYDSIFLYQSMSGDSSEGTSVFTMTGGKLISQNGEVFHVTSTDGVIELENVTIINEDANRILLDVSNDGWSSKGNNAVFNAKNQILSGEIIVSNAATSTASAESTLTMNLAGSGFKGTVNSTVAETEQGSVSLSLDENSLWELTGDSYVSSLSGSGKINYNGFTLYVNGTAYTADSPYTEDGITSTDETVDEEEPVVDDEKDVVFQNAKKTFKANALAKKAKTYSIISESDGGAVTVTKYLGKAKKYVSVSADGEVTVKKGTPKGVYKVRIAVAAEGKYKAAEKTIRVVVK